MYKIIGADGNQYGPVSLIELQGWIRERRANGDTLAQGPGMADWKPLREFPEFAPTLQEVGGLGVAPSLAVPAAPVINVAEMVAGPAVGLIVIGALVVASNLFGLLGNLLGLAMPVTQSTGDPNMDKVIQMMSGTLGVVFALIGVLLGIATIVAGIQMRKLKSYSLAMAMLILNMIPCCNSCCCLVGLPIGIWGLTVLMKPEVKRAFQS
ncbi:DUF4339 domain-containing protein [Fontisphaera persica]|uniref:DUF4339 domain-containing protein n=1 Tax=Fontisphaera persica TaxID=2974023 RepID=UPI0024BF3E0E|nr:DUF4339 domain-containing protein [Fontisphaera persica]WCJ58387.1 DUF4339 domain-containing protein [Fontisphaera persica]